MRKNTKWSVLLFFFLPMSAIMGQNLVNWCLVTEFQAYPTGQILSLNVEKFLTMVDGIHVRAGYNRVRHGDAGVHEEETGGGWGASVGYRRYFEVPVKGFYLGLRTDLWKNKIDWKDQIGEPDERSGTSRVTVVQPTLEGGYLFVLGKNWSFAANAALGYELNVRTDGEETGQGAILLSGLILGYRF